MQDDPREFVPPFVSPLTHDQHARLGRIAILWGQIDSILDLLLEISIGITAEQRKTLIGEKPIGSKLEMLSAHLDSLSDPKGRRYAREFWDLANQTKVQRNRCFHGLWGWRGVRENVLVAAAMHFKAGNDPVKATQLPALEKKLCKTARIGLLALTRLHPAFSEAGAVRLFHGMDGDPPPWLVRWSEQHPLDDRALDRRHKRGQLPYLAKPL
jgi:hypothetical protein